MSAYFIGLMSGTSLDGVDAVLVDFSGPRFRVCGEAFVDYPAALREDILALQTPAHNELDRSARLANLLAQRYAQVVQQLLANCQLDASAVSAIACHGQTIRHAPERGYTLQLGNLALLAELTGIDVIGDLRSRDVAAGGQGAPLVPAFHAHAFHDANVNRLIVNIGGIANLTYLGSDGAVSGFDSGPGNMLLDAWIKLHCGQPYDADGAWSASGSVHPRLLQQLLATSYFDAPPPKSTGRDLFDLAWLQAQLHALGEPLRPADVQATLAELVAHSIVNAAQQFLPAVSAVYLCGGGARNRDLRQRLQQRWPQVGWHLTDELGLPLQQVEATAFAWLGYCFSRRQSANLPAVTGASGRRVLGALYPA